MTDTRRKAENVEVEIEKYLIDITDGKETKTHEFSTREPKGTSTSRQLSQLESRVQEIGHWLKECAKNITEIREAENNESDKKVHYGVASGKTGKGIGVEITKESIKSKTDDLEKAQKALKEENEKLTKELSALMTNSAVEKATQESMMTDLKKQQKQLTEEMKNLQDSLKSQKEGYEKEISELKERLEKEKEEKEKAEKKRKEKAKYEETRLDRMEITRRRTEPGPFDRLEGKWIWHGHRGRPQDENSEFSFQPDGPRVHVARRKNGEIESMYTYTTDDSDRGSAEKTISHVTASCRSNITEFEELEGLRVHTTSSGDLIVQTYPDGTWRMLRRTYDNIKF